ncbi:MAG: sporulation integral membrane protein YtvI [Sporolactobacillus sp.]|jgi:sporulation integral membrane protein YtvI|nr:sporulation integral membrane protein YtvI [Sporolactobacillus sp.]
MKSHDDGSTRFYAMIACRALIVICVLTTGLLLFYLAVRFALPFLTACLLAALLNPVVSLIAEKTGLSRAFASFLILFLLLSVVVSLMLLTATALIRGLASFAQSVPDALQSLIGDMQTFIFAKLLPAWEKSWQLPGGLPHTQEQAFRLNIEHLSKTLIDFLNDLASRLLSGLTDFVSSLPDTLISALFVFLAAFFLAKDAVVIKNRLAASVMLRPLHEPARIVWADLKRRCGGYLRAQLMLVTLTVVLIYIGLLVLKAEHPLTVAIVSGIVDLIPYLGTGVIFIPWILCQLMYRHYDLTIGLSVLYAATAIQRQLLEPKLIAASAGIDPLLSLVVLYFGFRWFGFAGLIIAPMLLALGTSLHHADLWRRLWHFIIGASGRP